MSYHDTAPGSDRDSTPALRHATLAQPDRAQAAAWWHSMWHSGDARYVESPEDVRSQWELYEVVKFAYLRGLFPMLQGTRSLECGCGSGGVSLYFARRGYRTVLLDFAPSALALARRNYAESGVSGMPVDGDVNSLPFASHAFDVVMSFGLIEHFVDVRPIIAEMVRVCAPGGLVFLDIVPARFNVQTLANVVWNVWAALLHGLLARRPRQGWQKACALFRPPYYENRYSMDDYVGWMEEAGLADVVLLGNNPFPRLYLPRVLDRGFIWLLIRMVPLWRKFDYSGSRFLSKWWARAWWAHGHKHATTTSGS